LPELFFPEPKRSKSSALPERRRKKQCKQKVYHKTKGPFATKNRKHTVVGRYIVIS